MNIEVIAYKPSELPSKDGNIIGRMHDHAAFDNVDLPAVEFDFYHGAMPVQT